MLVHFNSADRSFGSPWNYTINVDITRDRHDYASISLVDLVLPQDWYNISAELGNNVFYYSEYLGGVNVDKSITLPDGIYSAAVFTATWQSLMTVNTGYTYTGTSAYSCSSYLYRPVFIFGTTTVTSATPYFGIRWSLMPRLAKMLGFDPVNTAPQLTDHVGRVPYNMNQGLNFAYLSIDSIPGCRTSLKNGLTCTFPITLSGNSATMSGTLNQLKIAIPPGGLDKSSYHVQLYREDGSPLKVTSDWAFTLSLQL